MNVFFVFYNPITGKKEITTPPLDRGDILPGVTRLSILELARTWGEDYEVVERFPTMPEVKQAAMEGRLLEAFGAGNFNLYIYKKLSRSIFHERFSIGTAAVVVPISCIEYEGEDIDVPVTGEVTRRAWDEITGIQYGKNEGPEGWSVIL